MSCSAIAIFRKIGPRRELRRVREVGEERGRRVGRNRARQQRSEEAVDCVDIGGVEQRLDGPVCDRIAMLAHGVEKGVRPVGWSHLTA